jgi:transmembrane sensor
MTPEQYMSLYEKYLSGSCTSEEEELLMQYQDNFKVQDDTGSKLFGSDRRLRLNIYNRITKSVSRHQSKIVKINWWWVAAAVLFLVILGGVFFNNQPPVPSIKNEIGKTKNIVIKPGRNTAVLTLANGHSIILDSAANGVLAKAGNTAIKKLKNGLLSYAVERTKINPEANALNTITIPRGGQYTIMLPDGTKVWLNSESSLTFPVAFKGDSRTVSLKGEAYFEVAKNKQMPFIVHTDKADTRVLGTHFNITAYQEDGTMKTTLLEGSVRLSNGASSALLTPGEQGISDAVDGPIRQKKVNVNQVVAWKAGYFIFRDDNIHDIMKQISRWYDVEVVFEGKITNMEFGGTYAKSKDIIELLKGLEYTGLVHFKIEGRRIIVMA